MLKEEDKKRLQERFQEEASDVYQPFSKELFKQYSVKRGLRNDDGTGVIAGLTSVGAVLGYYIDDGEKIPMEGHLRYRGYDLTDIVKNCEKEKRFGFEEVAYLLLFGELPSEDNLTEFKKMMAVSRRLPTNFVRDVIMKAPSEDIMNQLSKCVLTLASYDKNMSDTSVENVIRQSINLISTFPMISVYGYHAYNHYKRNKSLILISVIFILFIVVCSCINKIDSSNLEDMSSQIGEIKSYYNGNISIKDFTITNIKEYIRYLGSIGIFTLLFFTFPISIIVFIVKAISIGYTINTSVLLLGLSSFKMCIIVLLKNIVIIPMSIILIELAISYIKNVYKQLKKKRQDSIVALGKEFVLNLVIIMCASIILQTVLNIISISIIQFLAR